MRRRGALSITQHTSIIMVIQRSILHSDKIPAQGQRLQSENVNVRSDQFISSQSKHVQHDVVALE